MATWWLLNEPAARDAAMNMAVDQHLLELVDAGVIDRPVLRFYGWKQPTLSLGFHQQWQKVLDEEALKRHEVVLVRRWTGGRGVLHDFNEITYSVTAPMQPPFGRRVSANYRLIAQALHRFTDLGAAQGALAGEESVEKVKRMRHSPCFASSSQSEIEAEGKKLIGSAQKLGKQGFLQHGSIPLIHRVKVLEEITGTTLDMSKFMVSLTDHYADAGLIMPERADLVARLVSSFGDSFAVDFEDLTPANLLDDSRIKAIAEERFGRDDWTYRK